MQTLDGVSPTWKTTFESFLRWAMSCCCWARFKALVKALAINLRASEFEDPATHIDMSQAGRWS